MREFVIVSTRIERPGMKSLVNYTESERLTGCIKGRVFPHARENGAHFSVSLEYLSRLLLYTILQTKQKKPTSFKRTIPHHGKSITIHSQHEVPHFRRRSRRYGLHHPGLPLPHRQRRLRHGHHQGLLYENRRQHVEAHLSKWSA